MGARVFMPCELVVLHGPLLQWLGLANYVCFEQRSVGARVFMPHSVLVVGVLGYGNAPSILDFSVILFCDAPVYPFLSRPYALR